MKAPAAILLLSALPSLALGLRTGDVFEWTRQNLDSATETSTKVTVLTKGRSDSLPADSGSAWSILVEPKGAQPETLELFQFKDGALRWSRASKSFPVELDAPSLAARGWVRGGLYWGLPETSILAKKYLAYGAGWETTSSYSSVEVAGTSYVDCRADLSPVHMLGLGSAKIRGRWTDSVGPVWFSNTHDWTLRSRNGREIGWTNPRMDSVRLVVAGLRERARNLVFPRLGDVYVWRSASSFLRIPSTGPSSGGASGLVTGTVTEAPEDSAGWVRRTMTYRFDSTNGGTSEWTATLRRDTLGRGIDANPRFDVLAGLWSISRNDRIDSVGYFSRSIYEEGSGRAVYRADGLLLSAYSSYSGSVQLGCTSCVNTSTATWTLVSALGVVTGVAPRQRSGTTRLDAGRLREILAHDPQAQFRWIDLSGSSHRGDGIAFRTSSRASGIRWVEVRTSRGEWLRGLLVERP